MAKVVIVGDAVVVKSSMKLEDLMKIEKYRPEALVLKGGEDNKEELFVVSANNEGCSEMGKYGAVFGSATHDAEKLATITLGLCMTNTDSDDIKEKVANELGSPLMMLNKLEETLPEVLEQIDADKAKVMESISIN